METVLAIGVVSFAMLSILGLIPVGLSAFRNAMALSVETTIAQRLASDIQRTDYTNQISTKSIFYYDEQGDGVSEREAVFTVEVIPPQAIVADGILRSDTPASTVQIMIKNRMTPARTNFYPVVIPTGS